MGLDNREFTYQILIVNSINEKIIRFPDVQGKTEYKTNKNTETTKKIHLFCWSNNVPFRRDFAIPEQTPTMAQYTT
ncbi:hypothetical protein BpHYR1_037897 [Brachionus plicatilis]|uniref:Uncharacterized protein n=1 Tax=Brachionus plicatilis TaxID=10195 RepID=A0A3M7T3Y5_BRAPC|nr:hypothetical protein BpHYR1_037897 [Brachionus plicatilis]